MQIDIKKIEEFVECNFKELSFVIQPSKYLENRESIGLDYALRYLQNRVRAALFFFINGCFWLEGNFGIRDLLYPFYDTVEPPIRNSLVGLKSVTNKTASEFGVFKEFSRKLNKLEKYHFDKGNIADLFSTFYREFEDIASRLSTTEKVKIKNSEILKRNDYPAKDREYLCPLWELQKYAEKYLKSFLRGFYLHGSISTMDYIPNWSDVDTLMIVSKKTILNPESLLELRKRSIISQKYIYQIDPHQLHGHLIISEFDLAYFPQTYFPLILFEHSKSFFNENRELCFNLRDCELERVATFWNDAVYYFLIKAKQYKDGKRDLMLSRERKLFFHRLFTFPLFYLQAKGEYVYKKYSFEKARVDFSDENWEMMEVATSIMKDWKYQYKANRYLKVISELNPKIYLLLMNKYYDFKYTYTNGVFRDFEKSYEKWLSLAVKLSIDGWNKVIEGSRYV